MQNQTTPAHKHAPISRDQRRQRQRANRKKHYGLSERERLPAPPQPRGSLPPSFGTTVFGQVHPLLQHALAAEGYLQPTPIQARAIPHLLDGRDLFGCAQTGTGKTAAFLLPILHRLAHTPQPVVRNRPRALILAPTRELAAQIAVSTSTYSQFLGLSYAVVFGGVSQVPQVKALNRGVSLVVATPGRLLDLMTQGHIALDQVTEFVLDEADRMLDMGFLPDIQRVLAKLPAKRQTQFFSATLTPEILRLGTSMVKDPVHITITPEQPTVDKIHQQLMFVDKADKPALLLWLLQNRPEAQRVIVFARTRHGADKIVRKMRQEGLEASAIHSDKTQRARTVALEAFRSGTLRVLVATDIASRGIDVDGITHVINYDLPDEDASYIHRIGRTARAGASGTAISFASAGQHSTLHAIERLLKNEIPLEREHPFHSEKAAQNLRKESTVSEQPAWIKRKSAKARKRKGQVNFAGWRQNDFKRGSSPQIHKHPKRRKSPPRA